MAKYKWPKKVPILEPENFITHHCGAGECRDILGWASFVFLDRNASSERKLPEEVVKSLWEAAKIVLKFERRKSQDDMLGDLNDLYCSTNEQRAQIWNLAMKFLGYLILTKSGPH